MSDCYPSAPREGKSCCAYAIEVQTLAHAIGGAVMIF
jgi:hypothetical protein